MFLVVGLGNPGKQYRLTRHNFGFMLVDRLAEKASTSWNHKKQLHGKTLQIDISGRRVMLLKPNTYMNLSGQAVQAASAFWKISLDRILVIHDDLDLDFSRIQIRHGGGSGGHLGLQSVIASFGNGDFSRLRLGVGRPPSQVDGAVYVLEKFKQEEQDSLNEITDRASQAVKVWLQEGLTTAMNRYNPWPGEKREERI